MSGNAFLAKLGLRSGLTGDASSLAVALGTDVDDANRVGLFGDTATPGSEELGIVVGASTLVNYNLNAGDPVETLAVRVDQDLTWSGAASSAIDTKISLDSDAGTPSGIVHSITMEPTGSGTISSLVGLNVVLDGSSFSGTINGTTSLAKLDFDTDAGETYNAVSMLSISYSDGGGTPITNDLAGVEIGANTLDVGGSLYGIKIGAMSTGSAAGNAIGISIGAVAGGVSGNYAIKCEGSGIVAIADTTEATGTSDGALVISGGVGIAKKLFVGSDVNIAGKLTVAGAIDPTCLILSEQASIPIAAAAGTGTLWVKNDDPSSLYFTDDAGTDVPVVSDGVVAVSPGGSDTQIQYNSSGSFGGVPSLLYEPSDGLVQYNPTVQKATGDQIALSINYIVNKAVSGNDTGLRLNKSDIASPGTSLLLDLAVAAASKFTVAQDGTVVAVGTGTFDGITISDLGQTDTVALYSDAAPGGNHHGVYIGDNITGGTGDNNVVIGANATSTGGNKYSVIIGSGASATLNSGTAIGYQATVGNQGGTALGRAAVASDTGSLAVGWDANATGGAAVAIGDSAEATGGNCVAFGKNATAQDANCVVIGYNAEGGNSNSSGTITIGYSASTNVADSIQSIAIGSSASVTERRAIAIGESAVAARHGIAIGRDASVTHQDSVAIGYAAASTKVDQIVLGSDSYHVEVTIPLTTASTSTSTGALVVSGGAGFDNSINVGGEYSVFGDSLDTQCDSWSVSPFFATSRHGTFGQPGVYSRGGTGVATYAAVFGHATTRPSGGKTAIGVTGLGTYSNSYNSRPGDRVGVYGHAESLDGEGNDGYIRIGVDGYAYSSDQYTANTVYGLRGKGECAASANGALAYGGYLEAVGAATSTTAYGIYATASGAVTNWAGYFDGDVNITGDLKVSGTVSGLLAEAAGTSNYGTTSIGALASITTGSDNIAIGDLSGDTIASGSNNVLLGNDTDVVDAATLSVVAIGHAVTANNQSVAIGTDSDVLGTNNVGIGYNVQIDSLTGGAVVIGHSASTTGNDDASVVIGSSASVSAGDAIAIGNQASATQGRAVAIGQGVTSSVANQILLGSSADFVKIQGTTASTDSSTGALVVSGGVGIAGDTYTDGDINVGGIATFESAQTIAVNAGVDLSSSAVTLTKTCTAVTVTTAHATNDLNLWASPATGDMVSVRNKDGGGTAFDVNGNGDNIEGSSTYSIADGVSATFIYDGSEWTVF